MRYMLLICADESAEDDDGVAANATAIQVPGEPAPGQVPDEPCWAPWARLMASRGVTLQDGARLRSAGAATTVRVDGDEVLLSDGPFAETKEQIVGYDVIECADLDTAIEAAANHPVAMSGGMVEVRPIQEEDD